MTVSVDLQDTQEQSFISITQMINELAKKNNKPILRLIDEIKVQNKFKTSLYTKKYRQAFAQKLDLEKISANMIQGKVQNLKRMDL